jgi:hypothetical protein
MRLIHRGVLDQKTSTLLSHWCLQFR